MASYGSNELSNNTNTNRGFFSKILRNISTWGMDYDDMILKNSVAIGIGQAPTPVGLNDTMYDVFSRNAASQLFQTKNISYLDRSYPEKLRILREYSRKDEIRDFITIVADESVIYDEHTDFCFPISLSEEYDSDLKKKYYENFDKIYQRFGFKNGIIAWNWFRSLLIDGFLAYEIIFDDKYKNIIAFQQLDPTTLLPGIEPTSGDRIWIQYPEAPEYRRILLDSQIIYLSYSSGTEYMETSYVEGLIRPYNQLKLLEQTRIMFNIANAMMYKKFTIPVGGMYRQLAEEQVAKLIADYKDEVTWNDEFGTISINGSPHISYNKEYWFPETETGTPNVELIEQNGHNLNENDMLTWFYNALKRASKIPFTRFDKDNGGGNIFGDVSEMSRDELSFFNFVSRIRTIYKEILLKPWKIQMILDYPELKNDESFLSKIDLEYNGQNLFHEWKNLTNMTKRVDYLNNLSTILDSKGQPYFHVEWLVRDILKIDEETLNENNRWKKLKPTTETQEDGENFGTDQFGGGAEEFGGGESFNEAPEAEEGGANTEEAEGEQFDF